jgi:hypothetical protein
MGLWRDLCEAFRRPLTVEPSRLPVTYDYTQRYIGHDFVFTPADRAGYVAHLMGWGEAIQVGDFLILPHAEGGTTRYEVTKISYFADPEGMWSATARFAPRPEVDTAYEPSPESV